MPRPAHFKKRRREEDEHISSYSSSEDGLAELMLMLPADEIAISSRSSSATACVNAFSDSLPLPAVQQRSTLCSTPTTPTQGITEYESENEPAHELGTPPWIADDASPCQMMSSSSSGLDQWSVFCTDYSQNPDKDSSPLEEVIPLTNEDHSILDDFSLPEGDHPLLEEDPPVLEESPNILEEDLSLQEEDQDEVLEFCTQASAAAHEICVEAVPCSNDTQIQSTLSAASRQSGSTGSCLNPVKMAEQSFVERTQSRKGSLADLYRRTLARFRADMFLLQHQWQRKLEVFLGDPETLVLQASQVSSSYGIQQCRAQCPWDGQPVCLVVPSSTKPQLVPLLETYLAILKPWDLIVTQSPCILFCYGLLKSVDKSFVEANKEELQKAWKTALAASAKTASLPSEDSRPR